jgi:phosphate starvation-inducible PhoH-like protein
VQIKPRNIHQETYLKHLFDPNKIIIIATGPAGCGKTQLAMLAGIKALNEKLVEKIILCRPAVSVEEESHGFLPGTLTDKLQPWLIPLFDVLYEYYNKKEIMSMLESNIIETAPIAFMRGRNFKNSWVVLDDFQNASISQCKTILTRISYGSKIVITGDNDQSDRKISNNGLLFFNNAVKNYGGSKYIANVEFDHHDIERHPVIAEILNIFNASRIT